MEERSTDDAPASIGPFSQGIRDGDTIPVSGQGPIDPDSGDVVKTTVFVNDMRYYDAVNDVYGEYMSEPYPARSAVGVVTLPIDIKVGIEAVGSVQ